MRNVFIFALNTDNETLERKLADKVSRGHVVGKATGVYKGETETSWIVEAAYTPLNVLLELAELYNQDCIAYINRDGVMQWIQPDWKVYTLGKVSEVSEEVALEQDGCTVYNNRYYTVL